MLANLSSSPPCFEPLSNCFQNNNVTNNKRKRRPAGTPDPDAEIISLSPKTLMESDRYVCDICNQRFQRDQNLQMHRRRHKVPWKLLKKTESMATTTTRKRVFVCPEPSCLHHNPNHALGDLVGIKKHFRRKHSNHKQWVCEKCCKAYAVQSDYKAHLKTCGTRGHSCDCGKVFSRVESFIEHQDSCKLGHHQQSEKISSLQPQPPPPCLSRTPPTPFPSSPSLVTNFNFLNQNQTSLIQEHNITTYRTDPVQVRSFHADHKSSSITPKTPQKLMIRHHHQNLDLQLSTTSTNSPKRNEIYSTHLELSIGCCNYEKKEGSKEQIMRVAKEARNEAKREIELAEKELGIAKRMRQEAEAELQTAIALKQHAINKINSTIIQITCHVCRQHFHQLLPKN